MTPGYESFFGLVERPFSLTPDPKYFFQSRSHSRAIESLTFGLRANQPLLLVTGDLGVGKTLMARTLVEQLRRRALVSLVSNPLVTPGELFRLLLSDFGAAPGMHTSGHGADATPAELNDQLIAFLSRLNTPRDGAVVVIDEAHTLPVAIIAHLLSLAGVDSGGKLLQLVFFGQSAIGEPGALGIRAIDEQSPAKVRLLPLGRDECAAYVAHRLTLAGGGTTPSFTPRAIDMLYGVSGGVPRLVNLLCERALQEAASHQSHKIEPSMIEAASSALQLLRARPRRFRWFSRRVS